MFRLGMRKFYLSGEKNYNCQVDILYGICDKYNGTAI